MASLSIEQSYRYAHASELDPHGTLRLATCTPDAATPPHFFTGELARPDRTAKLLLSLMAIVQARFHLPPAMVERLIVASDPVVTSSKDRLRFEGFSGCCGAYARLDLLPEALRGTRFGRGTTNVDFNQPMLSALATMRRTDPVTLAVGTEGVTLRTAGDAVVEKRVRLPVRWLRGLVEVQACQQRMRPAFEVPGPEAARFLRTLPRMKTNRRTTWVVPSGRGLRSSQVQPRGPAVRVGGLERLRALERMAAEARSLQVFADDMTFASGWILHFDDCRFHLLVSSEVWRGFSGEGQVLHALANSKQEPALRKIQALLGWNAVIDPAALADRAEIGADDVQSALALLGTRGLVGFDLAAGAYFHRELPFDLASAKSVAERMQPRLAGARRLVAEQRVRISQRTDAAIEVYVASGNVEHLVRLAPEQDQCTCAWFAKHGSQRGPCKHVLAAHLVLENQHAR